MKSFVPNSALFHVETISKDNVTINSGQNKIYKDSSPYFEVPVVENYMPIGIVGYYISPAVSDGDGVGAATVSAYRIELGDTANTSIASGKIIYASYHANAACKVKFIVDVLYVHV